MNEHDGIEISGEFSPFIRACIGTAIVIVAIGVAVWLAAPVLLALLDRA